LIYKKNHPVTPKEIINVCDLGYLGVETDFSEQLSFIPNRMKRNIDLHKKKKSITKFIRKKMIDTTICKLKKYRILSDIFRNKLRKYTRVSDIVSELVNYRIINQYH
jgi:hypothetical protein